MSGAVQKRGTTPLSCSSYRRGGRNDILGWMQPPGDGRRECPIEQIIKATGLQVATEENHRFCIFSLPEGPVPLHAHVDDAPNGALDGTAASREALPVLR